MTISRVVPASRRTSLPRLKSPMAVPIPPPIPAPIRPPFDAVAQAADHRAGSGGGGYRFRLLAGLAVLADGAFFVLHRSLFSPRDILDGAGQHHGIAAGIDESAEVHEDLGAALDMTSALDAADAALHIGAGGNHDAIVDHHRKGGDGIDGIALAGVFCGNGLLERQRYLGAGRNRKLGGVSSWRQRADLVESQDWPGPRPGRSPGTSQQRFASYWLAS